MPRAASRAPQHGFSMIEVLVTLVILLVGLLGLAGMIVQSQRGQIESYQRVQAMVLLQDMVSRINANRKVASCYVVTGAGGTPYLGTEANATPTCTLGTSQQYNRAIADMEEWSNLLQGASETQGTNNAGAVVGARGCISLDSSTVPPTYVVSVAWQGLGTTAAPQTGWDCATNAYGDEAYRRVVRATVQPGTLDVL